MVWQATVREGHAQRLARDVLPCRWRRCALSCGVVPWRLTQLRPHAHWHAARIAVPCACPRPTVSAMPFCSAWRPKGQRPKACLPKQGRAASAGPCARGCLSRGMRMGSGPLNRCWRPRSRLARQAARTAAPCACGWVCSGAMRSASTWRISWWRPRSCLPRPAALAAAPCSLGWTR